MRNLKTFLVGTALVPVLTGCIDNNYDLSDIDTTSEFKINDLVLPVQLDPIMLSDIITVEEGDQLKPVTINGHTFYAVEENGEFESDPIFIKSFRAEAGDMETAASRFDLLSPSQSNMRRAPSQSSYLLKEDIYHALNYDAPDVDGAVREITWVGYKNVNFVVTIEFQNMPANSAAYMEKLMLQLPSGLSIAKVVAPGYTFKTEDYSASSGLLTLDRIDVANGRTVVTITSDAVDLKGYPGAYSYNKDTDTGEFNLDSEFTIRKGAKLTLEQSATSNVPDNLPVTVSYDITPMEATSILGSIEYDLDGTGLAIDPITLDNLPKFLQDPETNLLLANPQIYISITNPIGEYGLGFQSGISINAWREDESVRNFPLGSTIKVPEKSGSYNYLLAPHQNDVDNVPQEYAASLQRIQYPGLGEILAGKGLPGEINLSLQDPKPMIPLTALKTPLKLGTDLDGMKGTYLFLAPLALQGKSRIIYTETKDGWWSEDLEALTVNKLVITATVSSDVPMEAEMAIYPIDLEGRQMKDVTVVPVLLPANAKDQELAFTVTGDIRNLDGIIISATVIPDGSEQPLAPDQTIVLKDVKAKVSGNYTKKL